MTALSIIISIVLILVSIVLIAAVLLQQGQRQGLGAIGGGAETFFGKNIASSAEGKLKTITKIAAAVFVVLAIVATIITAQMTEDFDLNAALDATETHVHEDGTVHAGAAHSDEEEATEGETAADEAVEATAEPAADAAAAPVVEATAEPAADATAAPAVEATAEPAAEATAEPVADKAA